MNKLRGFTIIELLVVMAVIIVLAAGLFASQYAVREQAQIMEDQYRILSEINNAKSLTLGAFMRESTDVCGYGFYFEAPKTVILYRDKVSGNQDKCSLESHDSGYNSGDDEDYKKFSLNSASNLDEFSEISIMFSAPYLNTHIIKDGNSVDEAAIKIKSAKSDVEGTITINKFGQITTR